MPVSNVTSYNACRAYATSMMFIPLFVVSATLVDCDHIMLQKVEVGIGQDRSLSWLRACQSQCGL